MDDIVAKWIVDSAESRPVPLAHEPIGFRNGIQLFFLGFKIGAQSTSQ